jgi:hypothetical protein
LAQPIRLARFLSGVHYRAVLIHALQVAALTGLICSHGLLREPHGLLAGAGGLEEVLRPLPVLVDVQSFSESLRTVAAEELEVSVADLSAFADKVPEADFAEPLVGIFVPPDAR